METEDWATPQKLEKFVTAYQDTKVFFFLVYMQFLLCISTYLKV